MTATTTIGSTVVIAALALSTAEDAPIMLAALQAEPATTIQLVLPIDVVELTKAVFTGIAAVGSAFAAIYAVMANAKAKRNTVELGTVKTDVKLAAELAVVTDAKIDTVSHQINGLLADRDKASETKGIVKGTAAGEKIAETLAEGQRQGIEIGRASAAPSPGIVVGEGPVPVADEKTGGATERSAEALERLADVTEDTADTVKKL